MNKYQVISVIGEGAYGVVLKAKNKISKEIVAIKKFKEREDQNIDVKKLMIREIKMLKLNMNHENIVNLKEVFRKKGRLYLVFEYLEYNILDFIPQNGKQHINDNLLKNWFFQLLSAIDWCHKNKVVHRDIKPENVLVTENPPRLKLCDFGFARILSKKDLMTEYVSTRWYRAPEILLGEQHYSYPVDIWAVGCLFAECITGQPLFPGQNEMDQLLMIRKLLGPLTTSQQELFFHNYNMELPHVESEGLYNRFSSRISPEALNLLEGMLQIDPNIRYTSNKCLNHLYFQSLHHPLTTIPITNSPSNQSNQSNQSPQFLKNFRQQCLCNTLTNSITNPKPIKLNEKNTGFRDNHYYNLPQSNPGLQPLTLSFESNNNKHNSSITLTQLNTSSNTRYNNPSIKLKPLCTPILKNCK